MAEQEHGVPTQEEVWAHTKAIASWFEAVAPEDSEMRQHWNLLVTQVNALLYGAQRLRSLTMQRDQLSAALEESSRARKALEYIAELEPQGQAILRLRAQLGKVKHHAQLLERLAQQCQQEVSCAVEGAYQRKVSELEIERDVALEEREGERDG